MVFSHFACGITSTNLKQLSFATFLFCFGKRKVEDPFFEKNLFRIKIVYIFANSLGV